MNINREAAVVGKAMLIGNRDHEAGAAQVNLDFDSEAGMADTLRLACALQPVATALLACSPFRHGRPSGYLSYRAHAWASIEDHRHVWDLMRQI